MSQFLKASDVEASAVEWVIDGVIPRARLTLIAGRPGEGKSLLEIWLATQVAKNGGHSILSNVEDNIEDQRARIDAAGAIAKRIHLPNPDEPLFIPRDVERLEKKVKETGADLVVLDTAARHITTSIFDPQDCQRALGPVAAMARRTNCAVVLIHHLKGQISKGTNPIEAIGGAKGGLTGTCRFVYVFGKHDSDPDERVLAVVKANNGRDDRSIAFELAVKDVEMADGKSDEVAYLVLTDDHSKVNAKAVVTCSGGDSSDQVKGGKLVIAKDWVISTLMAPLFEGAADPVVKTKDLQDEAQACGISWATVRRALSDDTVRAEKVRCGYGKQGWWGWKLPADHPAVKLAAKSKPLSGSRP
jgi:predicted ATP-dependent serine protease